MVKITCYCDECEKPVAKEESTSGFFEVTNHLWRVSYQPPSSVRWRPCPPNEPNTALVRYVCGDCVVAMGGKQLADARKRAKRQRKSP